MVKRVVALDIGGTSMRVGLFEKSKILKYIQVPTPKTRKEFLDKFFWLVDSVIDSNVSGIGVGIASPLKNGKVLNAPNLPLKNYDLKRELEKKYKRKVNVKNDAGCFALAEAKIGSKKDNFLLIALGTGIGGGIVINGEEYRGQGEGAEFGHMYLGDKQWEELWHGTRKRIRKEFGKDILFSELVKMKTRKSDAILKEAADYLGKGISSLISAFDPEAVLIGGGIRESGNYFLNMVKKSVAKYSFLPKKTPVMWTKLETPGIYGASLLV